MMQLQTESMNITFQNNFDRDALYVESVSTSYFYIHQRYKIVLVNIKVQFNYTHAITI